MTDKYTIAKYTKRSKEKNKKIGKKNIYDIIHNTPELNLKQKVDYIRHNYAYYDGNYEYFYLKNGIPTPRLHQLNTLIYKIIKGELTPEALSEFNEKVVKWRKNRNEKINTANEFKQSLRKESGLIPKWKLDIAERTMITKRTLDRIDNYLKSKDNILTEKEINTISFDDLRVLSKKWERKSIVKG